MGAPPDQELLTKMEARAVDMAWSAGDLLRRRFGGPLEVKYKDKHQRDPVTSADKEAQELLSASISKEFPEHAILGEEGPEEEGAIAADVLWLLDPLDGTTNFLNGLPIYGVSIGALYQGVPVAGALFIPWPADSAGQVLHARRGGGAKMNGEALSMAVDEVPQPNRLTGLPGIFGARYRFKKPMRGRIGEVRLSGSVVYEMALTALGAFQYAVFGGPRVWDVAAGALVVMEAGGTVLVRQRRERAWRPLDTLGPSWVPRPPSGKELRSWAAPMVVGSSQVAPFVAAHIGDRSHFTSSIARLARKLGDKK